MTKALKKKELQKIIDNNGIKELKINAVNMENDVEIGYEEDMILQLLESIVNDTCSYIQDGLTEISDNYVEIYNQKLLQLYANNFKLIDYFNEAKKEGLMEGDTELFKMLRIGQYKYNSFILYSVVNHLDIEL